MKKFYKLFIPLLLLLTVLCLSFTSCSPKDPQAFMEKFKEVKSYTLDISTSEMEMKLVVNNDKYLTFVKSYGQTATVIFEKNDNGYTVYTSTDKNAEIFTKSEATAEEFDKAIANMTTIIDNLDPSELGDLTKTDEGWSDSDGFNYIISGNTMTVTSTALFDLTITITLSGSVTIPKMD